MAPPVKARPAIILIVGDSCSGKTTLGERVAKEQNLMFFCGARVLQTYANQGKSEWEKRALVIAAIEGMIKDAFMPGCTFRGVIIDRQGKTIDDIYYLNAMLRRNAWNITAVYNCSVKDDAILAERMRLHNQQLEDHTVSERIRAARYLVERCREVYTTPGVWHDIDTSGREDAVGRHFRGEIGSILSTNAHLPLKLTFYPAPTPPPSESRFLVFVEDVAEYADVITKLFRLLQKDRLNKFPGALPGTFLNSEKVAALDGALTVKDSSYVFRQSKDGTPYLLFHTSNEKVYLIPRHLRCVYTLEFIMWKKYRLKDFILEGDFVCDVNGSDVFYVSDCLASQGKSCLRRSWAERQKYISDCMIPEEDKFAPLPGRVTFLRQVYVDFDGVKSMVNSPGCRGIIMHPTGEYHPGFDERIMVWYPPTGLLVDLRVRKVDTVRDGESTTYRRLYLDMLSVENDMARYVDTGITVDVTDQRVVVAFGNIVEIALTIKGDTKTWAFRRVRYDRMLSDTKARVEATTAVPSLNAEDFLKFVAHMQSLQDPERKKITYQGDDVLKKLLELKHAPPTTVTEVTCKFFLKGRCRAGEKCQYAHPVGDADIPSSALKLSDVEAGNVDSQVCARCEKVGAGEEDPEDGYFYCNSCWDSYASQPVPKSRRGRRGKR
jgi:adenylate kinase family enzyme